MRTKFFRLLWAAFPAALLLAMAAGSAKAQPLPGAIFTTRIDCDGTNVNIFANKDDVYLDGGPAHPGAAGLPDGDYYCKVTEPNGTLLGTTIGSANETPIHVTNGEFDVCYQLSAILIKASDSTPGYDGTSNAGGEYKVWVSPTSNFARVKTDNFKVGSTQTEPGQAVLSGTKFRDLNADGVFDPSELGIEGVTIEIHVLTAPDTYTLLGTTATGSEGTWTFAADEDDVLGKTIKVCEVVPDGYIQTAPEADPTTGERCYFGVVSGDISGLDFGNTQGFTLSGAKFYDTNTNGAWDDGEPGIDGFRIHITGTLPDNTPLDVTVTTAGGGLWSYGLLPDGTLYTVEEIMPLGSWLQTAPAEGSYSGTLTADVGNLTFGNVCLGAGGGLTLGFWSNRNGQALIGADDRALLVSLNLRNADGSNFDPATNAAFRTWILGATATNMAYMLSAQLAAMELNVFNGFVAGGALIYAPGTNSANANGFATVSDLMAEANTELGAHGLVLSGSPDRAYQEALKNALDKANNNLNFVQSGPCPVEYP
jgi:hypothetical protein